MRVAEAVKAAKERIVELFEGESISDVVLEEVVIVETKDVLKITISFVRPGPIPDLLLTSERSNKNRSYKVVHVSRDGKAGSVFDRILRPAEY